MQKKTPKPNKGHDSLFTPMYNNRRYLEQHLSTTEKNTTSRNKFSLDTKLHYKALKIGSSDTGHTQMYKVYICHKLLTKETTLGSFLMKSEVPLSWHSCDLRAGFPSPYQRAVSICKLQRHPVVERGAVSLSVSLKHHCCRSWTEENIITSIAVGYSVRSRLTKRGKKIKVTRSHGNLQTSSSTPQHPFERSNLTRDFPVFSALSLARL